MIYTHCAFIKTNYLFPYYYVHELLHSTVYLLPIQYKFSWQWWMNTKEISLNIYWKDINYEDVVKKIIRTNLFIEGRFKFLLKRKIPSKWKLLYLGELKEEIIKEGKRINLLSQVSFRSYVDKWGFQTSPWWPLLVCDDSVFGFCENFWICLIAYLWTY